MGLDDDEDCAHERWLPTQLRLGWSGAELIEECADCGAVVYLPGQAARGADLPPLF